MYKRLTKSNQINLIGRKKTKDGIKMRMKKQAIND